MDKKFDPGKLERLNNPDRTKDIPPAYILSKLNIRENASFVEIGAGTAFFSVAFSEYAKPSKIYACDVSEVMIDWIKKNIVSKFPNIIPVKTEEHTVPLADEIADMVFMINLHHELDSPDLTLKEAYRMLKTGGRVCVVDWEKRDMNEGPPLEIRFSPAQVMTQMTNAGFTNVNVFDELPKHFLLIGEK